MIAVPTRISDAALQYASKYRSKARIPALSYLHWANHASITRCAQPLPGLKQARSVQDEKVVEAIFSSHLYDQQVDNSGTTPVYGATTTNLIVDARPRTNAMATYARGGGTENMDHYKGCRRDYLGIENIHVMRDSINRVVEALRAADEPTTFGMDVKLDLQDEDWLDASPSEMRRSSSTQRIPAQRPLDISALKASNWLRHLTCLLQGTAAITRNVHIASSHVMIHCSDGWDRTSQLSALSQVCLDPFFRTKRGFALLVEKEWLSFGHRFADRCGHGGSEKYFITAAGHGESSDEEESDEAEGNFPANAQAAANAFWGFTKQITSNFAAAGTGVNGSNGVVHGPGAHVKETSPVFTQFLDCVWQIYRQHPSRFEFNDSWLSTLHQELYECRFGTFLANSERERRQAPEDGQQIIVRDTQSVWNYLLAEENAPRFSNDAYDSSLDDPKRPDTDMGVLLMASNDVRWWPGLFGERVEEANRAIEFEESERIRRKAEKARWDEERAAERARKEAEEKKRLAELAAAAASTDEGPGSRISVTSSKGAVDLFTASQIRGPNQQQQEDDNDSSKLAYQPRQTPKSGQPKAGLPASTCDTTQSTGQQPPDAATRLKSWALGGWDRLQEVIGAPSPPETPLHSTWSAGSSSTNGRLPMGSVDENPWAATPASSTAAERAAGAQNGSQLAGNPWRSETNSMDKSTTPGETPKGKVDGLPNSLADDLSRLDVKQGPSGATAEEQKSSPSVPEQASSSSDPLGVGL